MDRCQNNLAVLITPEKIELLDKDPNIWYSTLNGSINYVACTDKYEITTEDQKLPENQKALDILNHPYFDFQIKGPIYGNVTLYTEEKNGARHPINSMTLNVLKTIENSITTPGSSYKEIIRDDVTDIFYKIKKTDHKRFLRIINAFSDMWYSGGFRELLEDIVEKEMSKTYENQNPIMHSEDYETIVDLMGAMLPENPVLSVDKDETSQPPKAKKRKL